MKKANAILTAIRITALVGSAVAFKAHHKGFGTIYCDDNSRPTRHCNVLKNFVVTTGTGTTDPCGEGDNRFGIQIDNFNPCPIQNLIIIVTTTED